MEEALTFLAQYWEVIVTVLSVLFGLKLTSDKHLKYFLKSGELAEKYADLVDEVDKQTDQ